MMTGDKKVRKMASTRRTVSVLWVLTLCSQGKTAFPFSPDPRLKFLTLSRRKTLFPTWCRRKVSAKICRRRLAARFVSEPSNFRASPFLQQRQTLAGKRAFVAKSFYAPYVARDGGGKAILGKRGFSLACFLLSRMLWKVREKGIWGCHGREQGKLFGFRAKVTRGMQNISWVSAKRIHVVILSLCWISSLT